MKSKKILLIGAGKFGKNYVRILKHIHENQGIDFIGIVVQTAKTAESLRLETNIPVYVGYSDELLQTVDAFFVVTPPETHFKIVSDCLRHGPVLVEKPVVMSLHELDTLEVLTKETGNDVMVGQLFRFHPLSTLLFDSIQDSNVEASIKKIDCVFLNDEKSDQQRSVPFELIHWFDLVGSFFNQGTLGQMHIGTITDRTVELQTRINEFDVHYFLGWKGEARKRYISVHFDNGVKIHADYLTNSLKKYQGETLVDEKLVAGDSLEAEILSFISFIDGDIANPVSLDSVRYSLELAETVDQHIGGSKKNNTRDSRPKVAIIGAGLFGCNIAIELADFCDVTLFEKNNRVLKEASRINQYRHHLGYHYPRSSETVKDIQKSAPLFETRYESAIVRNFPAYYAIAKENSNVTPEAFITFCDEHGLPYEVDAIPEGLINNDLIDISIKVPEPVYQYEEIRAITETLLQGKKDTVDVRLNSRVVGAELLSSGRKNLMVQSPTGDSAEEFDFVINSTYAYINEFTQWLGFLPHRVRIDVAEVLAVRLPISQVAVTVMDGPFGGFLPAGRGNEYTVYHAKASIIDRYTPSNGLVQKQQSLKSQSIYLYEECLRLFPILEKAEWVESRVAHRGVLAFHEHDDARVADIVPHGFGCWSVLSGKIQSCIQTAERIQQIIVHELR